MTKAKGVFNQRIKLVILHINKNMKFKSFQSTILLILLVALFYSCTVSDNAPETGIPTINIVTQGADSAKAIKNITGFLHWYKNNLHKANAFPLLAKDTKGYYTVNAKACTAYLAFLKTSQFISAKYIDDWQTYFNDKAATLRKEKIESDIPEGFDMDFVLLTQEPEILLNAIGELQFNLISISNKAAVISARLAADSTIQYDFEMTNSKGAWEIDYISTPNFD